MLTFHVSRTTTTRTTTQVITRYFGRWPQTTTTQVITRYFGRWGRWGRWRRWPQTKSSTWTILLYK